MEKLFIYIFLLSFCFTSAQETTKEYPKHSLGVNFQGNYSYRILRPNKDEIMRGRDNLIKIRNETERAGFGFALGINYLLKVHKNIGVEIGAQLVRRSDVYNSKLLDIDDVIHLDDIYNINSIFKYNYYYLDIPIRLNYYYLNKNKFHLFVSSGISTNIYLGTIQHAKIEFFDGEIKKRRSTDKAIGNHILLSYIGSFGFDYDITPKFTLRVEPIANVSFFTTQNTPLVQYPYSFGLNTGVFYNF